MSVLDKLNAVTQENADQRTADWHKNRLGLITSSIMWKFIDSDSAASGSKDFKAQHEGFGKGAVTIIKEKALEKYLNEPLPDDLDNVWAINFGKNWEASAAAVVQYMTKVNEIQVSPPFIKYEKNNNAGGSPDFLSNVLGVGELKCTNDKAKQANRWNELKSFSDLKRYKEDKTTYAAYWQLVSNCLFTGIPVATFASFCPSFFAGYTDDREYLDFSAGYAVENTEAMKKEVGCIILTTDSISEQDMETVDDIVARFVRLRDRFYEEILEKNRKEIPFKIG